MYTDPAQLAPHVFEARYPGLAATLRPGDAVVGTEIFGIGSSREQAVSALIACGVRAVIAPGFGRIFFRNCWNLGLPAIEASVDALEEGLEIELDLVAGRFVGAPGLPTFAVPPPLLLRMVEAGGLLALIRQETGPADAGGRS
jgi:3-isopropylmalate/(R)-2-methylmalate dehydratase small subunit